MGGRRARVLLRLHPGEQNWRDAHIGVTSDLSRRVHEHKAKLIPGFTSRYGVTRLAYYEELRDIRAAIAREKHLKNWTRVRKIGLIEERNPNWDDLAAGWYPRTL